MLLAISLVYLAAMPWISSEQPHSPGDRTRWARGSQAAVAPTEGCGPRQAAELGEDAAGCQQPFQVSFLNIAPSLALLQAQPVGSAVIHPTVGCCQSWKPHGFCVTLTTVHCASHSSPYNRDETFPFPDGRG